MSTHSLLTKAVVSLAALATAGQTWAGDNKAADDERIRAVGQRIDAELPSLMALYKHLHSHPELSLREAQTSARLAKELREIGFEVTEKVGGYGIVGVLKNGDGPTVMVRTDMDALPVIERTGL